MNYNIPLSLERMSLIKVTISLWTEDEIYKLITKFRNEILRFSRKNRHNYLGGCCRKEWKKIENKVAENAQKLELPKSVEDIILNYIRPLGEEILKYQESHRLFAFVPESFSNLFWTPQGTINKRKTAEEIIKGGRSDITFRYDLACSYCVENDIPILWNEMPSLCKRYFQGLDIPTIKKHKLVHFWTYDITGETDKMRDLVRSNGLTISPNYEYQYAFEIAASDGNKAATEYFFRKLSPQQKNESLLISAKYVAINYKYYSKEQYVDTLYYLLSHMDEEQQIQLFKIQPLKVLMCFLNWPWQIFFMETAERIWPFLSEKDFFLLLKGILEKEKHGYKDYDYEYLFKKFWQQSSQNYKEFVVELEDSNIESKLLVFEDKEKVNKKTENKCK